MRKFALRYTHCFTPEALYSEVLSPMAFGKFQDFLSGLVKVQRGLFVGNTPPTMDELLEKLMGNTGEVSAAIAARELLDLYSDLDDDSKLAFFMNLEQHFNANEESIKLAYEDYSA